MDDGGDQQSGESAYPRQWEADVVLRDGSIGHVRPVRPQDAAAIQAFHDRQSPESIYLRFFAPLPHLSDRDAHRFATVDHVSRVALVMEADERMVGIARYDVVQQAPRRAEVAFNVADDFQGRGVGSVLLEHLVAIGEEGDVEEFTADVLPQNRKMLGVFADAGFEVRRHIDDGVVSLTFRIQSTSRSREVLEAREHRAEALSMVALLRPASVAVVGVGSRPESLGRQVRGRIVDQGFTGTTYAVGRGPSRDVQVYARVTDLPGPVDLAVIAVPAAEVLQVAQDCATHRVKALLVLSAGFAEAGEEGAALQRELLVVARRGGMRVLGPNSFGLLTTRPEVRLNASVAPELPPAGAFGMFAQSGVLGISVLASARRRGLGITDFVSAGNRIDVSGNDAMQYWVEDPAVRAAGLYLESMGNPRKFSRIARRLAEAKPVVVIKSGTSEYGVPPGHTVRAASVGPAAFEQLLRQAGVIRVENVHQLLDVAQLVVHQPIPAGTGVAVVGNSASLGALAADSAVSWSLDVAHGPVNLPPDAGAEQIRAALQKAFDDPDVHSVIACFLHADPADSLTSASTLAQVAGGQREVTCIATFVGAREVQAALGDAGATVVPAYGTPEDGIRALAAATRYGQWRTSDHGDLVTPDDIDRPAAAAIVDRVLTASPDGRVLTAEECRDLLAAYGIEVWESVPVGSPTQAAVAAARLGFPAVVKSTSPIASSQPITGVRLDLHTKAAVRSAYQNLDERLRPLHAGRLVVQRMATPGIPCVIGSVEDPLFGPVVTFALAGPPREVMGDIGYRVPPLRTGDVRDLIGSVRAAPLLHGHGGRPPVDRAALEDVVARVSMIAEHFPEVASLELNPVNTHEDGVEVLGARIALAPSGRRTDAGRRALSTTMRD